MALQIGDIAASVTQVREQPRQLVNAPAAPSPVDGPQFAETPKKTFKPVLRDRIHRFTETEEASDA